jgi:hypothetical protein
MLNRVISHKGSHPVKICFCHPNSRSVARTVLAPKKPTRSSRGRGARMVERHRLVQRPLGAAFCAASEQARHSSDGSQSRWCRHRSCLESAPARHVLVQQPRHRPQPAFASPNFIDCRKNRLLGLMLPEVQLEALENQVYAEPPLEHPKQQWIEFEAEVLLVEGDSLAAVTEWV